MYRQAALHYFQKGYFLSEHRKGGQFGKVQSSWPLVKLTISEDGISMRTIIQEVRMKRESIRAIILQRVFHNSRFILEHDDPTIKQELEFWTFSPDSIATSLKSQGYSVSEGIFIDRQSRHAYI